MNTNRMINTSFWNDTWVETLSPVEKLIFIYLFTNSRNNMLGVYEISIKRISFETGCDIEMVRKALQRFDKDSKVFFINESYVILTNFTKHQKYNPNMKASAKNIFLSLPNEIKTIFKSNGSKGFERLCEWFPILEVEIESEIEVEIESEVINDLQDLPKTPELPFFDMVVMWNEVTKQNQVPSHQQNDHLRKKTNGKSNYDRLIEFLKTKGDIRESCRIYFTRTIQKFDKNTFKTALDQSQFVNIWDYKPPKSKKELILEENMRHMEEFK